MMGDGTTMGHDIAGETIGPLERVRRLTAARRAQPRPEVDPRAARAAAAEGGCGVIGLAASTPVAGRHLLRALIQMRNRGNGKGGGVAAAGLDPAWLGVDRALLARDYLLAVAYLEPEVRAAVEREHIAPTYKIDAARPVPRRTDRDALPVPPPEVWTYLVRVRPEARQAFAAHNGLEALGQETIEDELVVHTSDRLNDAWYAATGDKRAFVLSHGRDLLVLKAVGYADDVVRAYKLEDLRARVWIGHHRYPTKGTVWHPGGAHPFVGLHEALVHNGDLANYHALCSHLAQRGRYPRFLTDTEAAALSFDLLHRTYRYPLEYVIEALAPTTERDFTRLSPERQRVYRQLQAAHLGGSPDGPWFFLVAQSLSRARAAWDGAGGLTSAASHKGAGRGERDDGAGRCYRLLGITDTSMLRPQVFALQAGERASIGLAASERQAIDAALASLAAEDERFWGQPDRVWSARGGSHTDGGAFAFTVGPDGTLVCTDKFGRKVRAIEHPRQSHRAWRQDEAARRTAAGRRPGPGADGSSADGPPTNGNGRPGGGASGRANGVGSAGQDGDDSGRDNRHGDNGHDHSHDGHGASDVGITHAGPASNGTPLANDIHGTSPANGTHAANGRPSGADHGAGATSSPPDALPGALAGWSYAQLTDALEALVLRARREPGPAIATLTRVIDWCGPVGDLRRSSVLALANEALTSVLEALVEAPCGGHVGHAAGRPLPPPPHAGATVVVDARGFAVEGPQSLARAIAALYERGWRNVIAWRLAGHRFVGCGLGPDADGVRIDVYGAAGDYLGSGIDGPEITLHGDGQDQLAQITTGGRLVVHGDVGQTFMYAAKGGEAYIRGSAAGRPLINTVGRPRVVINGTCLDYLAESCMAGDPLDGGGFAVVNGLAFDELGRLVDLETPYPGGNLFSLASGGAIYVRDPQRRVTDDQLNGGQLEPLTEADWQLIAPYLERNAALFGIPVACLLEVDGAPAAPTRVYRKVRPARVRALQAEQAWVTSGGGEDGAG